MHTRLISGLVATVAACTIVTVAPAIAEAESPPLFYANGKRLTATPVPVLANGRLKLESPVIGEVGCVINFWLNVRNEHEHGEASNPERGYGEVTGWGAGLGNLACTRPRLTLQLERVYEQQITTTISAEMPLEEEFGEEAEACAVEYPPRTRLSECPNPSERKIGRVVSAVRRRALSLPWKLELIRGARGEREGVLTKVGLHELGEAGKAETQSTACFPKEKFVNPETAKEEERPAKYTGIPSGCVALDVIFPQIPLEFVFYGTLEIFTVNGFINGLHPSKWEFLVPGRLFSSEGAEGEGETTGEVKLFGSEAEQLINTR
jgi:hypothetical protein